MRRVKHRPTIQYSDLASSECNNSVDGFFLRRALWSVLIEQFQRHRYASDYPARLSHSERLLEWDRGLHRRDPVPSASGAPALQGEQGPTPTLACTPGEPKPPTPTPGPPTPSPAPQPPPDLHCWNIYHSQTFDGVVAPQLPTGWSSSFTAGPADCANKGTCPGGTNWRTDTNAPYTSPNMVFHDAPGCVTDAILDSPPIVVPFSPFPGGYAFLYFVHSFDFENGFDGGVLEVSINAGPFTDIMAAGAGSAFYNGTIACGYSNPLAGRPAWTGNSLGYIHTKIVIPGQWGGQTVIFRFRVGTDCSNAGGGWRIDNLYVRTPVFECGGTPTPTSTPSPSPTAAASPTPTPMATSSPTPAPCPDCTPTPTPIVSILEAEDALLTGCYRQVDPQASGGFRVDGIDAVGDSVRFSQVPGGTHLVFRYATPNTGHMTLYVNDIFAALIDFEATPGGWVFPFVDKDVVASIPEGSSVTLQFNSGDIAINLDYIQIYQGGPTPTPCPSCTPTTCFPFERFDDVSLLGSRGWVTQNNSMPGPGTTGWFQGSRFFSAQSGGYIAADFNNGAGLSTLSNWLLTPPITLQNGMMMSFWTRTVGSPSFPDRLQLRMSPNGASTNVGILATDVATSRHCCSTSIQPIQRPGTRHLGRSSASL